MEASEKCRSVLLLRCLLLFLLDTAASAALWRARPKNTACPISGCGVCLVSQWVHLHHWDGAGRSTALIKSRRPPTTTQGSGALLEVVFVLLGSGASHFRPEETRSGFDPRGEPRE